MSPSSFAIKKNRVAQYTNPNEDVVRGLVSTQVTRPISTGVFSLRPSCNDAIYYVRLLQCSKLQT